MKKLRSGAFLFLCLSFGIASAQESSPDPMAQPAKVLLAMLESVKPGKQGPAHEKTESLFAQAYTAAKWPTHYIGMDSLSGKQRSFFITPYASYEAWENDELATQKNATLSAATDRATTADSALLDGVDQYFFVYREEYSLNPNTDIAHARYFEFETFQIKPGHESEWDECVKLVKAAYEKLPGSHWAMYEGAYGGDAGSFTVMRALNSASELDKFLQDNPKFMFAMGPDNMKRLTELTRSAIASIDMQIFAINPHESYPTNQMITSDPNFWTPKPIRKSKAAQ